MIVWKIAIFSGYKLKFPFLTNLYLKEEKKKKSLEKGGKFR